MNMTTHEALTEIGYPHDTEFGTRQAWLEKFGVQATSIMIYGIGIKQIAWSEFLHSMGMEPCVGVKRVCPLTLKPNKWI